MAFVTLLSSDGQQFPIEKSIVSMCQTISRLIEAFATAEGVGEEAFLDHPIPLSNVSSDVLEKVVLEWCIRQTIEEDRDSGDFSEMSLEEDTTWVRNFLNISNDELFDLILAANYLDVAGLLELTCKHVASMIKGKSPEDIRRTFGIVNDLTPEEKHQIMKEIAWINLTSALKAPQSPHEDSRMEPFPLLSLPNEIISLIFRQMHAVDRLRARVCNGLYLLEESDRFTINELSIGRYYDEDSKFHADNGAESSQEVEMALVGPCSSYIDVLVKFASNTKIESLFFLCDEEERQLIPYVKSINVRSLVVTMGSLGTGRLGRKPVALFRQYSLTDGKMCEMKRAFSLANPSPSQEMGKEEINDDRLEEWTNGRVTVNIQMGGHAVTGEALFRVYTTLSVLHQMGISYTRGLFTTRRKDAQFFVDDDISKSFFIVIGSKIIAIGRITLPS
uniref:F-box domain-containing protein n=1 Tax=Pristionchus pacificus TaxID=54126 RepID=A0A2A6CSE0_PRIPA